MQRHAVTSAVLATLFVAGLALPQQQQLQQLQQLQQQQRYQQQPSIRTKNGDAANRRPAGVAQSAFSSTVVSHDGRGSTTVGASGSPSITTTFSYPVMPAGTPVPVQASAAPAPAPAPSADFFAPGPAPFPAAFAPAPAAFAPAPAAFAPAPATFAPAPAAFAPTPAAAPAAAPHRYPIIPVLRRSEIHDEAGQYALGFETGNGIIVEEQGGLRKNLDGEWKDDVVLIKRGSYSYPGTDGRTYRLSYTADENGFHPVADYLPKSP